MFGAFSAGTDSVFHFLLFPDGRKLEKTPGRRLQASSFQGQAENGTAAFFSGDPPLRFLVAGFWLVTRDADPKTTLSLDRSEAYRQVFLEGRIKPNGQKGDLTRFQF